jgi:prevent-host-death family protein
LTILTILAKIVDKSGATMKKAAQPIASIRNRRGEQVAASSLSATHAKNEFGRVLEMVMQGGVVVITKHDAPKAVMLAFDEFNALANGAMRALDTLRDEFDALYARMQTPKARRAMKAAFAASPQQLGKAAVAAARKRG